MAKFTIDLSGRGGLAPRFFGDINRTSASPELRYIGGDNQFADGIYNPFRRFGYLSPANDTFETVTNYVTTSLTTTIGSSQSWQYAAVAVSPSASTRPAIVGTPTSGTATSGSSLTISTTVPSYTLGVLTVIAMNATGVAPTSATFDGVAMTLVETGGSLFFYSIFQLVAPHVTTANVVVTWATGSGNLAAICAVTNNSSQSSPANVYGTSTATSASALLTLTPTTNDCLILGMVMSGDATHTQIGSQTELFNFQTNYPFRVSASSKASINTKAYSCCIYDDIYDNHYWGETGSGNINIPKQLMKGDGLDDRSLSQILSLTGSSGFQDLEIYQISGVRKLFYAYTNSSGYMEIGISDLPFASNNDTWLTGTVSGAFSHTSNSGFYMRKADNGFMYLFQDNVVHKIDGTTNGGTNGTITANVLVFPVTHQLVDAVDAKGKMHIAIVQRPTSLTGTEQYNFVSECGVYVWDKQTTVAGATDYIPVPGVKEIRRIYSAPNGEIRIICIGSNRLVQIRRFNGYTFELMLEVGINCIPVYKDSMAVSDTVMYWLGSNGIIYGHGSPTYLEKEAVFKLGNAGSGSGAILYGGGSTYSDGISGNRGDLEGFYISGSTTFKKWLINAENTVNGNVQTTNQGDVFTLVKYLPKLSTVNFLRIFGVPSLLTGSTSVATIKIYFNQSPTAWASKTVSRDAWSRGYIDIPINKPYANAIQLEIEFNSSTTLGRSDFAPAYCEVDYTPTETNK